MKRNIRTPTHPAAAPICEGFVIGIGEEDVKPKQALEQALDAVRESIPGDWAVKPLGKLWRYFEVRKRSGEQKIPMHLAWELARQIGQHRYIYRAEPALIMPGIDPSPLQVYTRDEIKQVSKIKGKSFRSKKHLICSKDYHWNLKLTSVISAWGLDIPDPTIGKQYGEGVVISHPDTGYTDHSEIRDSRLLIEEGYDFEDGRHPPLDEMKGISKGHGTSTASVIMSAIGPISTRKKPPYVSGSAPKALLVPMRVSTSVVHLSFLNLTDAILTAVKEGHHIISMSLGGLIGWDYLHEAINYAIEEGVILLAAAGNVWPKVVYPAKFDEVIAVAACNCKGKIWNRSIFDRSATGPEVDIAAPGESVWRAEIKKHRKKPNEFKVTRSSGTSYAVATAAGACALWLAYHGRDQLIKRFGRKNLAREFKKILKNDGVDTPPGWNYKEHGAGILNAKKLLEAKLHPAMKASGRKSTPAEMPTIRTRFPKINDFTDFFPDLDAYQVEGTLSRILHTSTGKSYTFKSELSKELLFHIATNPEVRSAIAKEASSRILKKTFTKPLLFKNPRFRKSASALLRQHMVGEE